MRASWVFAVLATALVAVPAHAHAASVSASRTTVTFDAAPGEANRVTVVRAPRVFRISDAGAPVAAGIGCTSTSPSSVECPAAGVKRLVIRVGDGDDVVTTSVTTSTVVAGGEGDDRLEGGEGPDDLRGGLGDDVLEGGDSSDLLDGGPGADRLSGGDETAGIFEFDAAVYATRLAPVRVSLDGIANDGEAGEGDNVLRDVELVVGGRGDDVLVGNDRVLNGFLGGPGDDLILAEGGEIDAVFGERGNDVLVGGRGTDGVFGGAGDDVLSGGGADDFLQGGNGDDRVRGGNGDDAIFAGQGRDAIAGGAGDDTLSSRDGTLDSVVGGPGADTARVDRGDFVVGVEDVLRPGSAARGAGAGLTGRRPAQDLLGRRAAVVRWVRLTVS